MSFTQNQPQSWLKNTNSVQQQAKRIAAINDDGTSADEILKVTRWALYALLLYSGVLGAMSYYRNFEPSFGHEAALLFCLCLAGVIELGKNFFAKWSLRIPFFRGFGHIWRTPFNTFLWIGAVGLSVVCFVMSIINSTKGGEQLATMLRQERENVTFQPSTPDLDQQINDLQAQIAQNGTVTWKGVQTYQAQKTSANLSKSLDKLIESRNNQQNKQREDFEKREGQKANNTAFGAKLVMSSGGYVELLQILLILLWVSCERTLLARALGANASPTPTGNEQQSFRLNGDGVSFNGNGNGFNSGFHNRAPIGYRNTTAPPVSEADRGLTEPKQINTVRHSPEAFKQHRANFYRYRANLKNGDGNRQTVCGHLKTALDGMAEHLEVADVQTQYDTYVELYKFQEIHEFIAKEYVVPADQTPLGIYAESWRALYNRLYLKFQDTLLKSTT